MVHHDLWDYDITAAPQLITVRHGGKLIDAVSQSTKQGFLFVFDRVTGKPLWPIEERAVPKSDMPGEQAWPTQPYPTAPPPFARQRMTVEDVNPFILTAEERAAWKDRISKMRNEGLFTPPAIGRDALAAGSARRIELGDAGRESCEGIGVSHDARLADDLQAEPRRSAGRAACQPRRVDRTWGARFTKTDASHVMASTAQARQGDLRRSRARIECRSMRFVR